MSENRNTTNLFGNMPRKKLILIGLGALVVIVAVVVIGIITSPFGQYKLAVSAYNKQNYASAVKHYQAAGNYKDAPARLVDATNAWNYQLANDAMLTEDYATAVDRYSLIPGYLDSDEKLLTAQCCYHYQQGGILYESGEYLAAAEEYAQIPDYMDSVTKEEECYFACAAEYEASEQYVIAAEYYELAKSNEESSERIYVCGRALIDIGDYVNAADVLDNTDYDDAKVWGYYASGWEYYEAGNYVAAENYFRSCSGIEDADEMRVNSAYLAGMEKFENGDYDDARGYFITASGYDDSDDMKMICDLMLAEEEFRKGNLYTAQSAFQELPSDLSYDGISVEERLALLEEYSDYVDICGNWESTSGTISSYRYYTYTSAGWGLDIEGGDHLTIRCIIEDDGSVTIKGNIDYEVFEGYTSIRDDMIYYYDFRNYSFTVDNANLNEAWSIRSTATLTYTGDSFHLVDFVEDIPYSGTREEYTTDEIFGSLLTRN